jgi:hypothetical protein
MNAKYLFTLLFLVSTVQVGLAAISSSDMQVLYENRTGGDNAARQLENGLASKDDAVIFLRTISEIVIFDNKALYRGDRVLLLANLGDYSMQKNIYDGFLAPGSDQGRAGYYRMNLLSVSHPGFIAILGEDIYRRGGKIEFFGTMPGYEVPYANAAVMIRIVACSGYFSQETVHWARKIGGKHDFEAPQLFLEDARAFWATNREHLVAGRYDLVRPPVELATGPAVSPPSEYKSAPSAPTVVRARKPPRPAPTAAVPNPVVAEPFLWPWLLAGVALVLTIFLIVRPKR